MKKCKYNPVFQFLIGILKSINLPPYTNKLYLVSIPYRYSKILYVVDK